MQETQDIQQNKLMAVLAYFGILVAVPILAAMDSKFVRFHVNQGVILGITAVVYNIGTMILSNMVGVISFHLSTLSVMVFNLGNLVFLVLMILGIVNAYKGELKELPGLGKYKILE